MKHHYSARNFFDGTGTLFVFVATILGVMFTEFVLNGHTWKSLTASLVGAMVLVSKTELRNSDVRGKRARLMDRLITAFSHGVTLRMGGAIAFGGKL